MKMDTEVASAAMAAAKGGRHKGKGKGDTIVKRASRRYEDDDHGGNWKVAFADFCLALMCLFLLLWVLGARDEETLRSKVSEMAESIAYDGSSGFFEGVSSTSKGRIAFDEMPSIAHREGGVQSAEESASRAPVIMESENELRDLAKRFEQIGIEANLQNNLSTVVTPFGLRVMLHDTDNQGIFERGSAVPVPLFQPLLARLGKMFAQIGNALIIVGHTDSVPYRGSGAGARSNWNLSSERALSVQSMLYKGGMPRERVLQMVGMADRAPLSEDARAALNRRIEFLVLTPRRARMIEAMFAHPQTVVPLIDGVNAVAGERQTIPDLNEIS